MELCLLLHHRSSRCFTACGKGHELKRDESHGWIIHANATLSRLGRKHNFVIIFLRQFDVNPNREFGNHLTDPRRTQLGIVAKIRPGIVSINGSSIDTPQPSC